MNDYDRERQYYCKELRNNTVLCYNLASLGYAVVSLEHPTGSPIVACEDGSFYEWQQPETISKPGRW